jgi:hypothetical protein
MISNGSRQSYLCPLNQYFYKKIVGSESREGVKVQVQFAFLGGSSPAFTFAPGGIKWYF